MLYYICTSLKIPYVTSLTIHYVTLLTYNTLYCLLTNVRDLLALGYRTSYLNLANEMCDYVLHVLIYETRSLL